MGKLKRWGAWKVWAPGYILEGMDESGLPCALSLTTGPKATEPINQGPNHEPQTSKTMIPNSFLYELLSLRYSVSQQWPVQPAELCRAQVSCLALIDTLLPGSL